jgi:hypothetical protein
MACEHTFAKNLSNIGWKPWGPTYSPVERENHHFSYILELSCWRINTFKGTVARDSAKIQISRKICLSTIQLGLALYMSMLMLHVYVHTACHVHVACSCQCCIPCKCFIPCQCCILCQCFMSMSMSLYIYVDMPERRTVWHPISLVPDWKKLTMLEQVRYQTKLTQSSIFLFRYRTKFRDAGIPMPALVSLMPMLSFGEGAQFHSALLAKAPK